MHIPNSTTQKPAAVDVLIVGAGPSGLMLSTWLARLGISTRIIDKKHSAINSGQADGLQSRTFEILDSLGIGQDIWREANHMLEIRFWNPGHDGKLYRSDKIVDTRPGLSRFQQATLHQARIEDYLLKYIAKHSDISVERGIMPESLTIDAQKIEHADQYPISVVLRHLPPDAPEVPTSSIQNGNRIPNGLFRSNLVADQTDLHLSNARESSQSRTETVHAKYLVGCDGAHSWTRRQIGSVMEGEQTDYIWGVLDIIPITNFPDIRYRCAIHSVAGSLMVIPRENGYVRLYIQITQSDSDGNPVDRYKTTPETLLESARSILAPYTLTYKHCHWWTAYRIGQRLGSKFSMHNRVFLAGDAVHTHSPKAGQGMNISMHDTYNLGWKLAHVIKGWASPALLETYVAERRMIAKELIEFDQKFSRLFSGRPAKDIMDTTGIDLHTFKTVFEKGNLFASGCAVDYPRSMIVTKPKYVPGAEDSTEGRQASIGESPGFTGDIMGKQFLASKIPIGMRIPSYKVLNQSDARPWHVQELLPSTGAWRLLVFAGDVRDEAQVLRYQKLGIALSTPGSLLHTYIAGQQRLIEVLTIHSAPRVEVELDVFPEVFRPFSEEYGWDYNKIFVDDHSYHEGHGKAYDNYGIDPMNGCIIIVRPDQYVSWIGDLEDVVFIESFFSTFMKAT